MRVVLMLACPSHFCTLAMSAPLSRALVAAVARSECTPTPCRFDAGLPGVVPDDALIHALGVQGLLECPRPVVLDGPKERPSTVAGVPGRLEVRADQPQGYGRRRQVARSCRPCRGSCRCGTPSPFVHVLDAQLHELFPADAVVQERGEDGAVALALEGGWVGRLEQRAGLGGADGGGAALPCRGAGGPGDARHGVVLDGVLIAQVGVQRAQGGELAADGAAG